MKIFDGEILNSREHFIFDLTHRWECLLEEQQEEQFDYEYFRKLAIDTFQMLFPLHDEGEMQKSDIPRDIVQILLLIKAFATNQTYFSYECAAAQWVAEAFCSQISTGWIAIDGQFSKNQFSVEVEGTFFIIDTSTFDLTSMFD